MKKEKDPTVIVKNILNKMLEHHGVNFTYVMEHQKIDELPWFQYYTMTPNQHEEWKDWVLNYLKTTNIPKSRYKTQFMWLDLMWGLKIKEDDITT